MKLLGNGASSWDWIGCPKCGRCERRLGFCLGKRDGPPNGRVDWPKNGSRRSALAIRKRKGWGCSTSTDTCGSATGAWAPLPRLYVARQKLLLRGTTDYWVNGLGGEPFFVVTQAIHAGLIAALREQVIPRLLTEAPQVEAAKPKSDPLAMR